MLRALGIALLIGGIILLIFGISSSQSLGSDFSKFFTGSPTEKSVWMIAGGAAAIVAGLVLSFVPARTRRLE